MSKDRGTVDFGVEDKEYADRISAAKTGAPPIGGVPMPAMPRLDQPPAGDRHSGVQSTIARDKLISNDEADELARQGKLRQGVGSAYTANQPAAASVVAQGGEVINPPRPEGGLSSTTVKQLEELAKTQTSEVSEETLAKQVSKEIDNVDYDGIGQHMRSLLNNKERRLKIESRIVDQINVEDLIIHRELRQQVPIIPGKLVPTFRSVAGHEDLWVKVQMGALNGSETYLVDRYAMMNLCCGLYAINGRPLVSHIDKDGYIIDSAFEEKYKSILRYPWQLLADLSVNYVWFSRRVERSLVVDDIKVF